MRGRYAKWATVTPVDRTKEYELWERALASENGIAVPAPLNSQALRIRMYRARNACGHHRYDGLALTLINGELWIAPRRG